VRTKRKLPRGEGCKVYGFGKEQRYVARSDTDHGLVSFLEKKNRRAKEVRGAFPCQGSSAVPYEVFAKSHILPPDLGGFDSHQPRNKRLNEWLFG
jgi:hypothetical protein